MIDDFAPLTRELDQLQLRVQTGGRKRLAAAIATDLRGAAAKRLKGNVTAEGEPMIPRKPREDGAAAKGKTGRMFQRATAPQHLRKRSTDSEAIVGFLGAAARIMRVHQYGLRDRVSREAGAPEATYSERHVIGLSDADRRRVLGLVDQALAA